ncbi:MAG: magnesium/cobalt transporter CorA [Candidatus Muirbacterium halophilum]|nr:magnesium/cobalt transporter CorA [Candidatus Muirbacterium halophilum]MCK9476711.1 magnesium/cobalt transporter CorA [Candidatus Muirbacterium halophilum]
MAKIIKHCANKIGRAPGTLLHTGEKKLNNVLIEKFTYSKKDCIFEKISDISKLNNINKKDYITWINICGLHDIKALEEIGKIFNIHSLTLEDILHTEIRPKYEELHDSIFFILKMYLYNKKTDYILTEQVSFILKDNIVLTFQEREGDVFDPIRERLKNNKGKVRSSAADYLLYTLADSLIDQYFVILENFADKSEEIEEILLNNPNQKTLSEIYKVKRELLILRKTIWPVREIISSLLKYDGDLIKKDTEIYIRDLYEHTISIIDTVETLRDMASGMVDLYISSVSNRMNEIMKVLTIFSAIFIPLTFIAGVYGMNFANMPELSWEWGYFGVLALMLLLFIAMIFFFKKKKWM